MELYIPQTKFQRNPSNGRFLAGHTLNRGRKIKYRSEEARQNSLANLNKRTSHNGGNKKKKIVLIKDGVLCGLFESVVMTAKKLNISQGNITRACKHGYKVRGYKCFYEDDDTWTTLIKDQE